MTARFRKASLWIFAFIMAIVLAGATYQGVATALERRKFPHPGRLVDVGGHQLHIYCTGEGSPRVVLEAPVTGLSAAWARVQPDVARRTRVCSYDRAGLGWSEAGDRPYDPGRVPEELHRLLEAANEPGPYVLGGYSLGASFIRRFASLYPHDVAALVLINPDRSLNTGSSSLLRMSPWLARAGIFRATGVLPNGADDLPQPAGGAMQSFLNRPDHLTRAAREWARWDDAVQLAENSRFPAAIPVATLTVDGDDQLAMLSDEAAAQKIRAAILSTVSKVRRK
jgi:pimeloyl-ACP methyl ester carboxylesterase